MCGGIPGRGARKSRTTSNKSPHQKGGGGPNPDLQLLAPASRPVAKLLFKTFPNRLPPIGLDPGSSRKPHPDRDPGTPFARSRRAPGPGGSLQRSAGRLVLRHTRISRTRSPHWSIQLVAHVMWRL